MRHRSIHAVGPAVGSTAVALPLVLATSSKVCSVSQKLEESLILKAWKSFALGFYGLNGLGL